MLGSKFQFHLNFKANSGEPDQTPHSAASNMVLQCLSMSNKNYAMLILVKNRHHLLTKHNTYARHTVWTSCIDLAILDVTSFE